jgi:hypothetical protein
MPDLFSCAGFPGLRLVSATRRQLRNPFPSSPNPIAFSPSTSLLSIAAKNTSILLLLRLDTLFYILSIIKEFVAYKLNFPAPGRKYFQ